MSEGIAHEAERQPVRTPCCKPKARSLAVLVSVRARIEELDIGEVHTLLLESTRPPPRLTKCRVLLELVAPVDDHLRLGRFVEQDAACPSITSGGEFVVGDGWRSPGLQATSA